MESWKTRINYYNYQKPSGRFRANEPCRKHPSHRQSPGVCSICLSEKLSQLTNPNVSKHARSSSSSSSCSYISPLSSSSCSSPVNYHGKSIRVFKNSGEDVLKKSRSTAFVSQMRRKKEDENGKKVDIKRGFWSKLLFRKNKRLMHSRTMRERVVAEVH